MLEVEKTIAESWADLGEIPEEAADSIREKATFSMDRIDELEKETRHDVVAFIKSVEESLGDESRFFHYGVTSYDVVDTALSMMLCASADVILLSLTDLMKTVKDLALQYRDTVMIGRTHGIHAEPTTYGLKLLNFYMELDRDRERLSQAKDFIRVGKISGAVGTHATVPVELEKKVCFRLGLEPASASSQVLQRDRHAHYLCMLAILGGTLERMALSIRLMQQTEVGEAREGFKKGQAGSSAMPHKKNPVLSEQVCGLARILRANTSAALQNQPLWHERDISHSSVERVILADSSIIAHYLVNTMNRIFKNLEVDTEKMKKNLDATFGTVYSQKLLMALTGAGMKRSKAYQMVQSLCFKALAEETHLKKLVMKAHEVMEFLSEKRVEEIFNLSPVIENVNKIFQEVGIIE
ncbi:MAG: adenylosuccinate lyase [Candidatus Eremiobacteraeota bacterium]|nr:adenylosuccinate lyase [Candidatus Eremiobacteraeota bacterium]